MEIDRAQTDLGEAVNAELSASKSDLLKQPKKRFIGRKAAAEKAEKNGGSNGTIEDSGAIQGLHVHDNMTTTNSIFSCTTEKNSSCVEPGTPSDSPGSRDQRCHLSTSSKLLLRDSQNHTQDTYIRL